MLEVMILSVMAGLATVIGALSILAFGKPGKNLGHFLAWLQVLC